MARRMIGDPLQVRFTPEQRAYINKMTADINASAADVVRMCVEFVRHHANQNLIVGGCLERDGNLLCNKADDDGNVCILNDDHDGGCDDGTPRYHDPNVWVDIENAIPL